MVKSYRLHHVCELYFHEQIHDQKTKNRIEARITEVQELIQRVKKV